MRFISIDSNLRVLLRTGSSRVDKWNNVHVTSPSYLEFKNGIIDLDDDNEEAIARLRGLAVFGTRIFEGVAPDDVVATQTVAPQYICGFPKCKYNTFSPDDMQEHKNEEHSKKGRARKLRLQREEEEAERKGEEEEEEEEELEEEEALPKKKKKG